MKQEKTTLNVGWSNLKMDRVVILSLRLIFPHLSPQYPKELKWERKAVSRKCQQCHYINGSRPDSTRHPEVVIEPSYPSYVYHIKQ